MGKETDGNLTRKVTVRFKDAEYKFLQELFKATTARKLSGYVRDILLRRPVTVKVRNQSADEFLAVALQLKRELNAIGNNYNQAVHKLHMLDELQDMRQWLIDHKKLHEQLVKKTQTVGEELEKIYQQLWSQK